MRIALFSGNYNYLREGANQALNRLVHYLENERGHSVRVYSPVTDTPAFQPAGTLVPVASIALPIRSEFRLALGLPSSIREDLRQFSPDLIHLSTPDILGTRAQSFGRRHGISVVASLHTRFETYLEYYRLGLARPLVEAHLRRFYRRCDHVFAPTPALVQALQAIRGDDRVSLWSRGIDCDLFNPARRDKEWRRSNGWSEDDVAVLFFGRLVLEKNIAAYESAIRAIQRSGRKVRPLIVGAGPAADVLETIPEAMLTGHLEGPELARAVASSDIFLHASKTETFGNVVLEAMASGVAIVCADTDSARALIEDGRTGILCAAESDFEEAIVSLIDHPERRGELGAAARRASTAYSWQRSLRSVARIYDAIPRDRSPSRPA